MDKIINICYFPENSFTTSVSLVLCFEGKIPSKHNTNNNQPIRPVQRNPKILPMRILFVTKDTVHFRALKPVADALTKQGHTFFIVAEGLSLAMWEKTEHAIIYGGETEPKGFESAVADRILTACYPDVVVVGLSSPINAEGQFTFEANKRKIPVVAFSDTWGATSRMKLGEPNLILTVDALDAKISEGHFPTSRVVPVGDWLTKPVTSLRSPWTTGTKSIFIAGQNPATTKDFVLETLGQIGNRKSDWEVAFRPHPKYKDAPGTLEVLELLRKSRVKLLERGEVSGDELAATAHITVSSFSRALRVACLYGKVAVSVQTPNCIAQMEKSTGLKTYPLVELGLCLKIPDQRTSFADLFRAEVDAEVRMTRSKRYSSSILPNLGLAISEILALAEN